MPKRNATKYDGVFWRESFTNGKTDKTFYIAYKNELGKRKEIKLGKYSEGIRENYCKQKRDEVVYKIRMGESLPFNQVKKSKFTLNDAFDIYIEWAKANKKTWKHNDYTVYIKHIKPFLGKKELITITTEDFEKIKQLKLKEGYKPKTVVGILGAARHMINYCIKNNYVKSYINPIANGRVRMPVVDNAKLGFLTYDQASKLLDTLKAKKSPTMYNLTVLLLFTGARFSEIAGLTWSDINFETNLIYFKSSKNGNARYITIVDEVKKVLQSLPKTNTLVIPSRLGTVMHEMPKQWQTIVDELIPENKTINGKYRITTHNLRHTHASWMALEGADILQIKEQLGHKKLDMTLRYSHLIPNQRHNIAQKVFDRFKNG
ncbi:tyrosine-type recombinase/integrase [Sulfurospirillum sp. 1612]|uniref:tyrosine-type recombinase/integrase n=1 Tax=Sulfurospirillum sp. 1612 TaxID=3094835 RepID=UPI002F935A71